MKQLKNYDAVLYELLKALEELDVEQNDYPTLIYLHYDVTHKTGQIIAHAYIESSDYLTGGNLDMLMEYPGSYEDWTEFYEDWDVMDILEMADFDDPDIVLEIIAFYTNKQSEDVEPCDVMRWLEDMGYRFEDNMDALHEYRDDHIRNDGEFVNARVRLATDLLENYVMTDLEELERLDKACDRITNEIRNRGEQ